MYIYVYFAGDELGGTVHSPGHWLRTQGSGALKQGTDSNMLENVLHTHNNYFSRSKAYQKNKLPSVLNLLFIGNLLGEVGF